MGVNEGGECGKCPASRRFPHLRGVPSLQRCRDSSLAVRLPPFWPRRRARRCTPSPRSNPGASALRPLRPRCRQKPAPPTAHPQPASPIALPPVPLVEGALAIHVVYPATRQLIESRDSNFIFGSIGNGRASLTIDGAPVRVYPNGAFLGWVANPPAATPRYHLVATRGTDTARFTEEVRVHTPAAPNPTPPDTVRVGVDTATGWIRIGELHPAVPDTDDVVIGRPVPGDTYRWFLLPGTVLERTGKVAGYTRVQLDRALQRIWIHRWRRPRRRFRCTILLPGERWAMDAFAPPRSGQTFVLPVGERPAYLIEERGRTIDLYCSAMAHASTPISSTTPPTTRLSHVWNGRAGHGRSGALYAAFERGAVWISSVLWDRGPTRCCACGVPPSWMWRSRSAA